MLYQKYENILSEPLLEFCNKILNTPNWSYGHTSTPQSTTPFWNMDLTENKFFTDYMFNRIKEISQENYILHRVYANGQTQGQNGDIHIDDYRQNHKTFLFYPLEWNENFGGETEFFNDKLELISSYLPKKNTGILFSGEVLHRGNAPIISDARLRITVAFKLERIA